MEAAKAFGIIHIWSAMGDTSAISPGKSSSSDITLILSELNITTSKPIVAKCIAESSVGEPHIWMPSSTSQSKSTSHTWLHHEAHICVSQEDLQSKGIVFKVVAVSSKKPAVEFLVPLTDMQLRHSINESAKPFSFTAPDGSVLLSFKAHLSSASMLANQLRAMEDDEKLMAIQDLLDMAKQANPQLHTYLMDDRLLQALLELTTCWLHDALFHIELSALLPELWKNVIRSPFYQCVQYFTLDNGVDCDFFEYFTESMLGRVWSSPETFTESSLGRMWSTSTPRPSTSSSSGRSSPSTVEGNTSSIFFNRERKVQMIHIFGAFARKSVPHGFRHSLMSQVGRLIELVSRYLMESDLKSSSPKTAQEDFLVALLNPQFFSFPGNAPHGLLLPMLTKLLEGYEKLGQNVVKGVLEVLKSLPAPTSSAPVSNCSLLSQLDILTENDDKTIAALATYNWSKYMMFLTSSTPSQKLHQKGKTSFFTSRELSESCTVISGS